MMRPRGVRWRNPSWSRYGSYTSSIVSGSSPSETASVDRPTGPPPNLWAIADRSSRSMRSSPASSTSSKSSASCATSIVTAPPKDAVRHPRGPARAARNLVGCLVRDLDPEDPGRAAHDRRQLGLLVVAEPERHAEAVAKRCRQEARSRRRADEGELRQVQGERPRPRTLADDDVEAEVLERRVQDLLDRSVHAVDLVDEEDVLDVEAGQDGC